MPVPSGAATPGTMVTTLRRDGRELALVTHRAGLFDDPALTGELAAGSSLALENGRLSAELNAWLADLRESRARVAAAADAERRRLKRNLHDGAQQHLTALLFAIGAARARVGSGGGRLGRAETEVLAAAAELRALARGLYPAVLATDGLAAALESLAEEAPVRITGLPGTRLPPAVETAAYFVVATIAGARSDDADLRVSAIIEDGRLVLQLRAGAALSEAALENARDRAAAVDGELAASPDGLVRVSLPCG